MMRVNIHEAKTHLSRYLQYVAEGHTVTLCRYGAPVAEIRPLPAVEGPQNRQLGIDKERFVLGDDFFAPLPKEVEDAFAQDA